MLIYNCQKEMKTLERTNQEETKMMKERRYVLRNGLIFDTKENKKMYPVGKWNKYQHVFYNYMDRCFNSMCG